MKLMSLLQTPWMLLRQRQKNFCLFLARLQNMLQAFQEFLGPKEHHLSIVLQEELDTRMQTLEMEDCSPSSQV
jgi:hypothetical protein